MSAKSSPSPEPDQTPARDTPTRKTTPAAPEPPPTPTPEPTLEPGAAQKPGTYQYIGALPTQYLDVPLTAYPAGNGRPATVFTWPSGPPADGRWAPTKKKPNQVADNAPAASTTEE